MQHCPDSTAMAEDLSLQLTRPGGEDVPADPCCIRCAQLYKMYPDLECNPEYREDGIRKGLTRQEATGCKNCRTLKLKCYPVPKAYQTQLATLQTAAKLVLNIRRQHQIPVAAFYQLRSAQHAFSTACPVEKIQRMNLENGDAEQD